MAFRWWPITVDGARQRPASACRRGSRRSCRLNCVAQRIEMLQRCRAPRHLPASSCLSSLRVFLVHARRRSVTAVSMRVVDPRQRRIVRRRRGVVDDRVDELARGRRSPARSRGRLPRTLSAAPRRPPHRAASASSHDHPPQRQRPLQRADIGAGQIAIGRDVAVGQLVQETADLADITIDRIEVTIIRTISPRAMPTILRRIDWLNTEKDFTTPRIDRGVADEAEP